MPSQHKKALRESKLTHTFFNQNESSGCSGCRIHSHNHASQALDPGNFLNGLAGLDPGKVSSECSVVKTNYQPDDETSSSVITSYWREKFNKLTPEERERLHADIELQPAVSDPTAVSQSLKLALKQMKDKPVTAHLFKPVDTFDLGNLDEVAKVYDVLHKKYKDEEERDIATIAAKIGDYAATTSDPKHSSEDHLAAELDIHNLNVHSMFTIPLISCLRQVQLFNIEKRFGCVEESYLALHNDDKKRRGEDAPAELPRSYRQKWNNPSDLTEPASKQRKWKGRKKLSRSEVLGEFQRNCKLAIKEMQDQRGTISDAVKPIQLPSMPALLMYNDVPVPKDIPDSIRERFFDAAFAYDEILFLQAEAFDLLRRARGVFANWHNTSHEVWYVHFEAITPIWS